MVINVKNAEKKKTKCLFFTTDLYNRRNLKKALDHCVAKPTKRIKNMTATQFYVNYTFEDEEVNDNGEMTENRIIEIMIAFNNYKTKSQNVKIK